MSSVIWRRSAASWRTAPSEALEQAERRRRQFESARRHDGRRRAKSLRSAAQLQRLACAAGDAAVALAHDVALLMGWLRHDILAVAGPCHADRRACTTSWWPN